MIIRQAVLLVGGRATRMWPITAEIPKGLLPVAGRPFIEYQLDRLRDVGVTEVFLTVGRHLLDVWESFAAAATDPAIHLIIEEEPLDTAGGVRLALDRLDDRFFVLNGDVVLDADLSPLVTDANPGTVGTIALVEVEDTSAYGLVVTDAQGIVERFLEKTPTAQAPVRTVNAGVYVLSRRALEPYGEGPLSFERVVFPDLAASGSLAASTLEAGWLDIGTPALYLECHRAVLGGESGFPAPSGVVADPWRWVDGAVVHEGATVEESVVMPGAIVESGAVVRRAIVGWGARIGPDAVVDGASVIGSRAVIGAGCEVSFGARVAPDTHLVDGSLRFSPPQ